jgi:hypothetical protein
MRFNIRSISCAVFVLLFGAHASRAAATKSQDGAQIENLRSEPDTAGQVLYAIGLIGDLYKISPYSVNPERFLLSLGLYYQALAIDPTTLRAFAISTREDDPTLYEIKLSNGYNGRF